MKPHPTRVADIVLIAKSRISRTDISRITGITGLVREQTEYHGTLWSDGSLTAKCHTTDGYQDAEIEVYEAEVDEWWMPVPDKVPCAAGN